MFLYTSSVPRTWWHSRNHSLLWPIRGPTPPLLQSQYPSFSRFFICPITLFQQQHRPAFSSWRGHNGARFLIPAHNVHSARKDGNHMDSSKEVWLWGEFGFERGLFGPKIWRAVRLLGRIESAGQSVLDGHLWGVWQGKSKNLIVWKISAEIKFRTKMELFLNMSLTTFSQHPLETLGFHRDSLILPLRTIWVESRFKDG